MCGCGIRGGCAQFQHCLQGKLVIFEELNLTRDEKRRSDEERKKAEEKLGLAHKTIRELEEAMKRIDKKMKRVEEEKMRLELQLADTIDGHNINAKATRVKVHEIKKSYPQGNMSRLRPRCYCYPTRGYNRYVRTF